MLMPTHPQLAYADVKNGAEYLKNTMAERNLRAVGQQETCRGDGHREIREAKIVPRIQPLRTRRYEVSRHQSSDKPARACGFAKIKGLPLPIHSSVGHQTMEQRKNIEKKNPGAHRLEIPLPKFQHIFLG
jgi:hypothetical protein